MCLGVLVRPSWLTCIMCNVSAREAQLSNMQVVECVFCAMVT